LRAPRRRAFAAALGVFMLYGLDTTFVAMTGPAGRFLTGGGWFQPAQQNAFEHAAAFVRQRTSVGERILVWGWQPELYVSSQRSPVTRMVDPGFGTKRDVLDDLNRYGPPAAVVLPGPNHFGVPGQAGFVYELSRHPDIANWLVAHHYFPALLPPQAAPYLIFLRSDLASTEEIDAVRARSP